MEAFPGKGLSWFAFHSSKEGKKKGGICIGFGLKSS